MSSNPASRTLPGFAVVSERELSRPISFITVHFSGDLQHNLLLSDCVSDPLNELIVVDNRQNVAFPTLGAALLHGMQQARHELMVLVHEDVLLLPGWQRAFEDSLQALEQHDPDWGVVGVVGWLPDQSVVGHWSDPAGYNQLMAGQSFAEVECIDEQVMVLRRSSGFAPDPRLPSIHNIGRDLPRTAALSGRATYVVDAPSVHKFADENGKPILCAEDSPKIRQRNSLTYQADFACSAAYLESKWSQTAPPSVPQDPCDEGAIILLSRGGGGSRLLSLLALDCGIDLGTRVSSTGESAEMIVPLYQAVLEELRYPNPKLREAAARACHGALREMRERAGRAGPWGFKLPELLLLAGRLPELFPKARFVHMVRDPVAACLRRTHMTARTDNQIGQACLRAAYAVAGLDTQRILDDSPAMRMAITTQHQVELTLDALASLPPERCLQLHMEDLLSDPDSARQSLLRWLGSVNPLPVPGNRLEQAIDQQRAANPGVIYPPEVEQAVSQTLASLRRRLGYPDRVAELEWP